MAYCEVSDVHNLTHLTFTANSRPTEAEVEAIIEYIADEMDGVLEKSGYTVPVTTASALGMLETYNSFGAAVACWHTGYVSDVAPARVEWWDKQYQNFLTRIRKCEQGLPGVVPESDIDPAFAIVQMPPRDTLWTGRDEPLE